ncbi:MAG TPA: alcohol dehydrogenase catalytic domain-containing protein [Armatimonadota bacterium]|nr:alcohol dehydrogenase catalytic domain-containing protein [Armatimonadota bacterium]
MSKSKIQTYKAADNKLPKTVLTWHLFGAGMENFGRDHKPIELPMPKYGPDELLVRVDAVGICMSDIKVINQGDQHPRLVGRNLEKDPVTLGHEPSITVVGVGEQLKDKFKVGDRFIVQADVFYGGKSMAFGYVLPGAQTQYQVLTKELLEGDEGTYLFPLADSTGYAEAALTEPWACVVASYRITRRPTIKPGGLLWIIGGCEDGDCVLDLPVDPRLVVATDLDWPMFDQVQFWSEAGRFELRNTTTFDSIDFVSFASKYGTFDDIIILGADADIIEKAAEFLGKHGIMNIVATQPLSRPVKIDVGKVHYMNHSYIGTTSRHIGEAYDLVRVPSELKPGGTAWFIGAGGPMGQMHLPRALELADGPKRVIATDIDTARLQSLKERFMPIAARRGIELEVVDPNEMSAEDFDRLLNDFTGGTGFDDIVVLAPVAALIEQAVPHLADQGLMNIFVGLPIGTIANLDLTGVYARQVRFVGSSGSKLSDLKDTLSAAESGALNTNASVAAIGGIEASWDGMVAAKEGRFPGKVVIYPQIRGLELTGVPDLKARLPNVYAKLTDGLFWNNEAEEELLRSAL